MNGKEKQLRLCTVLLILNLGFIWGNSMLPGSLSGALSDWVREFLSSLLPMGDGDAYGSGLLRKAAHFLEFASLGCLTGWHMLLRNRSCFWALPWGMAAACMDETIQCFVPGRGPGILDVAIDSCGVLAGILLLQTGNLLWRNHQQKQYGGKQ